MDNLGENGSIPIEGRSDFGALANRKQSDGSIIDLSQHTHSVTLTKKDLQTLAGGMHVTIDMPKIHHKFYFSADDATLEQIRLRKS